MRLDTGVGMLLDKLEEAVISIKDPIHGASNAQVVLRPVDLRHLDVLVGQGGGSARVIHADQRR